MGNWRRKMLSWIICILALIMSAKSIFKLPSEVAKRGRPRKEDTQRARLARQKAEWKKVKAELMNNKGKATESEKENMNVDMNMDEDEDEDE
jgi:hypothetical protein